MSAPSPDQPAVYLPPAQKAIATLLVMGATMLVVLDSTIANVAIPHMQAALGATPDTVAWVLTSYITATAVGTPVTGWLAGRFGRARLFWVSILGFTAASGLCGLAVTLPMMVGARLVQGAFGAFLIPLSQSIVYDLNAPSQQARALAIWGAGVMAGPILAPVLGGYLAETFNWRWVFFVNIPIGLLCALGVFLVLPRFPDVRRGFDLIGFLIIAVALCCLQLALDRGTQEDWFSSAEIIIELGVAAAAFWMLAFYLPMARHPILAIELFRNMTFLTACMMVFFILAISTASSALVPSLLQNLMGYPIKTAGIVLIPRGVAIALAMLVGARLMKVVDNRLLIFIGLGILAWSLELHSRFTLDMDADLVIWSGIVMGIGSGLAMGSVNFMAISSTTVELRTDAAAIYGLFRSIGQALIIAVATALLARNLQIGHAELGSALQLGNAPFNLSRMLGGAHSSAMVASITDIEINRQAMMIAYIDDFWLMKWALILLMPCVFLMRPLRSPKAAAPVMVGE